MNEFLRIPLTGECSKSAIAARKLRNGKAMEKTRIQTTCDISSSSYTYKLRKKKRVTAISLNRKICDCFCIYKKFVSHKINDINK